MMAAEIRPVPGTQGEHIVSDEKPILVSKITNFSDDVNGALFLPDNEGIITVSDERAIKVWLKRDNDAYWPSVSHTVSSPPTCLSLHAQSGRLFVGLDKGVVMEFILAHDYNSMNYVRSYLSHQAKVTGVVFSCDNNWLLSVSRDKYFQCHCTVTGRRIGGYLCSAWCTTLQFDSVSCHAFVGDYSGQISMLQVTDKGPQLITTLKGHSGSVRALLWDSMNQWLFSGSYDQIIIVWDIGGQKGTAYELQGHQGKVMGLCYSHLSKTLISGGEDSVVVCWNMSSPRQETPEWAESDNCQLCSRPFFWNVKAMVDQKVVGFRQHHCRRCGKAVCAYCSSDKSALPILGFEFPVRVCVDCKTKITDQEKVPLASIHEVKHTIVSMDYDDKNFKLLTVGVDRVIKIWDLTALLK